MYCPQCGTEAEEGARFCGKCGRALSGSTEQSRPAPATREVRAYAPNHRREDRPHVPNHLAGAILSTVCCCPPTGIVSIAYAAQVNGKVAAGDLAGARKASQNAKTWAWVSVVLGIILYALIYAFFYYLSRATNALPAVLP